MSAPSSSGGDGGDSGSKSDSEIVTTLSEDISLALRDAVNACSCDRGGGIESADSRQQTSVDSSRQQTLVDSTRLTSTHNRQHAAAGSRQCRL